MLTSEEIQIPEKTIKTNFGGSEDDWADSLIDRIKNGDYASQAPSWISCADPRELDVREGQRQFVFLGESFQGYLKCPQVWAIESSTSFGLGMLLLAHLCSDLFGCSTVFDGYGAFPWS